MESAQLLAGRVAYTRRVTDENLRKGLFSKAWAGLREAKYDSEIHMTSNNEMAQEVNPKCKGVGVVAGT